MAAPYRWRGPTDLRRGKATWNFATDKISVSTSYSGPMSECVSAGKTMPGKPIAEFAAFGLTVVSAEAEEGDGESGVLQVQLEATLPPDENVSLEPLGEPEYDLQWGSETKALENHPNCGYLKADRPKYRDGKLDPTGRQRTWEDWQSLDVNDYVGGGGALWTLATYKEKREKGIDGYNVSIPCVSRKMRFYYRPASGGTNYKEQPPAQAGAPESNGDFDYLYLKTGDDISRVGRVIERTETWTGYIGIDEDLY